MTEQPYRNDIRTAFVVIPMLLTIEAWRRQEDLLSPAALDDALVGGFLLCVAYRLVRRHPTAPLLWVFGCGGAWFLMVLSTYGSLVAFREPDPSGMPIAVVLSFKAALLALVSVASVRALRLARTSPFSGYPPGRIRVKLRVSHQNESNVSGSSGNPGGGSTSPPSSRNAR